MALHASMIASVLIALLLGVLIAGIFFSWIYLSPRICLTLSGFEFTGIKDAKFYLREKGTLVDFTKASMMMQHFSMDNADFEREKLGALLWGAKLAVSIQNFKLGFSKTRMKFIIRISQVSVFHKIVAPSQSKTSSKKGLSRLGSQLFRLFQLMFSVEIDRLDITTTTLPKSFADYKSVYFVGVCLEQITIFKEFDRLSLESRPPFHIEDVSVSICEYCTKAFEPLLGSRHVVASFDLFSFSVSISDNAIRFDLKVAAIKAEIILDFILFVATIVNLFEKDEDNSEHGRIDFKILFTCKVSKANVSCLVPHLEGSLNPFESLMFRFDETLFNFILEGEKFNYLGTMKHVSAGSYFAKQPDVNCFTKLDRILNRINDGRVEEKLILIDRFIFSNNTKLKTASSSILSSDVPKALLLSMLDGKVNWDYLKNLKTETVSANEILENLDILNPIDFLLYSESLPNSFIFLASRLVFSIPFEFPLSHLIESGAVMIKAPKMMVDPNVKPQSFNIFKYNWELILSCPNIIWRFGDDPFESKLSKVLTQKAKFYPKLERLEKMFHKRMEQELDSMKKSREGVKDQAPRLPLARSSSFADLLEHNPVMINKYAQLQRNILGLYKKTCKGEDFVAGSDLMRIQISELNLRFKWDTSYLGEYSIQDLLNAIENSRVGYSKEMVDMFSVFLGAFMEFSGRQLNVYLRDYESEFISIDQFQICGPVFLLEEGAYPEACVKVPVKTRCISGDSNICGKYAHVTETILPIKLFHSLGMMMQGEYGFRAAFCPFWDGMFVGLDRAFDMLSKQSREKSPRLPIWDKFRLFMHSSYMSMFSDASCYFSFFPGKAGSVNESLVIKLNKGFRFELGPDAYTFEFEEFEGLVESRSLATLHYLLESKLACLDSVQSSIYGSLLKLVHFAKTRFTLTLENKNCDQLPPIEHQLIRMAAEVPEDQAADYDSYKKFRIASNQTNLKIETVDREKLDVTALYLYDELINWVKQNLMGYTKTCVRKGPLFHSPFIVGDASSKDEVTSIVDEIHFQFYFHGKFSCLYLNFYDSNNFGGLHLSSTQTFIALDYAKAKSDEASVGIESKWVYYYGEVDFKSVTLEMISSDPAYEESCTLIESSIRRGEGSLMPASLHPMLLIESPRLFYSCRDDLCFAGDKAARATQLRSNKLHDDDKIMRIAELTKRLSEQATMDPIVLLELNIQKEQQHLINEISEISRGTEKHFYFIHDAKLYWHQDLRDSMLHFVDQQFVRHMIRSSKSRLVLEGIRSMHLEPENPGSPTPSSPKSTESPLADSMEDVKMFYEKLMKRSSTMYASKEEVDEEGDAKPDHVDIRSPLEVVEEDPEALDISKISDIFFYNVELTLLEDSGSCAVISAPLASVEIGRLVDCSGDVPKDVGSRTKVSMEDMRIAISTVGKEGSDCITEPTSAVVVGNNKNIHYKGPFQLEKIGMDRGNSITLYAPNVNLAITSQQYAMVSDIISRLLVYRDPGQKERADQLEALVLASDVLDKGAIISTLEALQLRAHGLEQALNGICYDRSERDHERILARLENLQAVSEELGLIFESMETIKSSKDKWSKKQLRLQLDVIVDQIELAMLRPDKSPFIALTMKVIHDTWISDEDFSMSNSLEIGSMLAINKTPGSFYTTLLQPLSDYQAAGIGLGISDRTIRFYWKSLLPIGGIPIIEHAEVNVAPLTLQVSYEIAQEATRFFFTKPAKPALAPTDGDADFYAVNEEDLREQQPKRQQLSREASFRGKASLSRVESMDEIMSMKQKASSHCSFISIQVPATQHMGKPGTTITDIENFLVKLPSFEYHNQLWSWSEMFMQLKKDAVRIAYMNAGSLLKEKIKRLGQSNLSEAEKLNKTPTKAKPAAQISTDVTLLRVHAVYIMK